MVEAPRPPNIAYDEISSSLFSLTDFQWRVVQVRAVPSLQPAGKKSAEARSQGRAGGFSYGGSSLGCSTCRNRFILW